MSVLSLFWYDCVKIFEKVGWGLFECCEEFVVFIWLELGFCICEMWYEVGCVVDVLSFVVVELFKDDG